MKSISEAMKAYMQAHPFDSGDPDCKTVLDQLYRAYAESHESDPPEILTGYAEMETFLEILPLSDNNGYLYVFLHTEGGNYHLRAHVRYCAEEPGLALEDFNTILRKNGIWID